MRKIILSLVFLYMVISTSSCGPKKLTCKEAQNLYNNHANDREEFDDAVRARDEKTAVEIKDTINKVCHELNTVNEPCTINFSPTQQQDIFKNNLKCDKSLKYLEFVISRIQ